MARAPLPFFLIFCFLGFLSFAASPDVESSPARSDQTVSIRVDVNMVALYVIATDDSGRFANGLSRYDFKVFENEVEQHIQHFIPGRVPVSWGIVLDRSGSMANMMRQVYQAGIHMLDAGLGDEMFLLSFNEHPQLLVPFTSERKILARALHSLRATGNTALWDAVGTGLEQMQAAKNKRKVLVVVTDGEDNASSLSFGDLLKETAEAEVPIYPVGMGEELASKSFFKFLNWGERKKLEKLARLSGANAHFPQDDVECARAMQRIAEEVASQYSIGYYPDIAPDGTWRMLRVIASDPLTKKKLRVQTRLGYFAKPK